MDSGKSRFYYLLKGKVSREIFLEVFFHESFFYEPLIIPWAISFFSRKFAKIFAAQGAPAAVSTKSVERKMFVKEKVFSIFCFYTLLGSSIHIKIIFVESLQFFKFR